jgi:hypothetical protein
MQGKNQLPRRKMVKTTATAMAIIPVLPVQNTTYSSKNQN